MDRQELLKNYDRAELGIDGNCGFALLGPDIQSGEAEFVEIEEPVTLAGELSACKKALRQLRDRLGVADLNYYFGKSHPYGS